MWDSIKEDVRECKRETETQNKKHEKHLKLVSHIVLWYNVHWLDCKSEQAGKRKLKQQEVGSTITTTTMTSNTLPSVDLLLQL